MCDLNVQDLVALQKEFPTISILKTPTKLSKNKPVLVSEDWSVDEPDYDVGHIAFVQKVKLPKGHRDGSSADFFLQEANKTEKKFKTEQERIGKNHPHVCIVNIHFHPLPP